MSWRWWVFYYCSSRHVRKQRTVSIISADSVSDNEWVHGMFRVTRVGGEGKHDVVIMEGKGDVAVKKCRPWKTQGCSWKEELGWFPGAVRGSSGFKSLGNVREST